MKKNKLLLFPLLFAINTPGLYADTVELSNGKMMHGKFIGREGDAIKFEVDGINMSFQAKDVKNISMGDVTEKANSTPEKKAEKKAASGPATIASGTGLTVRLSDVLNSGKHTTGHKFSAVLEGALVSNGVIVAPAGSKVYGIVSEAVKSRRLAGQAKMIITLTDININGQITPIETSGINALTVPTGASTVGTAARGAAIGALVDGSSGARTGAKVGLGAAILRGGNQVVIPVGTLLDFKLAKELQKK